MNLTAELLTISEIRAALGVGGETMLADLAPMVANLRRFALKVLEDFPGDAPDEYTLQDLGFECGLLVAVTATEPCGTGCWCAEYHDEFPCRCYRRTPLATEGTER